MISSGFGERVSGEEEWLSGKRLSGRNGRIARKRCVGDENESESGCGVDERGYRLMRAGEGSVQSR